MKIIDLVTGVVLGFGLVFYAIKQDYTNACICGIGILVIINSYRIDELEKRK